MVRGPRLPKTRPSHCPPRPQGSSRPVVATTSHGATHGGYHQSWCHPLLARQCALVLLVKGPREQPRAVVPLTRREGDHEDNLGTREARLQGLDTASRPRLMILTTDRGRSRGHALATWEGWKVEEAIALGTIGTTMSRGPFTTRPSGRGP
ncbi:hypothetical protein MTR67_051792 [Solanum verrucosum]|uniref:Uncharacterized protein n=1 Tax=Solanum verrucosum TaxID=315347 RepID=A0AAF0V5N1_SOLVR|nr:hypothetical protein MTR67_051792 [Solanum verrucosum]